MNGTWTWCLGVFETNGYSSAIRNVTFTPRIWTAWDIASPTKDYTPTLTKSTRCSIGAACGPIPKYFDY
jgi:hypothetical protein